METAIEVLEKIQTTSKSNKADDRMVKSLKPGQWVRQGDVYLMCVDESWPHGKEVKGRQLVPGNSKGSRHIAGEGITIYEGQKAPEGMADRFASGFGDAGKRLSSVVLGPLLHVTKRSSVTHPEHGDYSLPGGCYVQVTYQADAKSLRSVQD